MLLKSGFALGTIVLSSEASDYEISYQKVDITEATYNKIKNRKSEIDAILKSDEKTLTEMELNVKSLQEEYEALNKDETATQEQKEEAQKKYNDAYENYNVIFNTVSQKKIDLANERATLYPDYTENWIKTTPGNRNVQFDLKDYSGTIYFAFYAKIENGTETYYDVNTYSMEARQAETVTINKDSISLKVNETAQLEAASSVNTKIAWLSSDNAVATVSQDGVVKAIKKGTTVITAKGSETSATCTVTVEEVEWTDFSSAKFELKKDSQNEENFILEISNIEVENNREYFAYIYLEKDKPEINTSMEDKLIKLSYDSNKKVLKISDDAMLKKFAESEQDIYIAIIEKDSEFNESIVMYGKKLEIYSEPPKTDDVSKDENNEDNKKEDNTTAKGDLPYTGSNIGIWIILSLLLIGVGAFSYIQYRKNSF